MPRACVIVLDARRARAPCRTPPSRRRGLRHARQRRARGRRARPAEPGGARARQRRAARGLPAAAGRAGGRRPPARALEGQGHDDRPLGDDGHRHAAGDADVPARLPARRDRPVHAPHRRAACSATSRRPGRRSSRSSARSTRRPGKWIVYTSADSVFQIAAHEETIPLEELYEGAASRARSSPASTPSGA